MDFLEVVGTRRSIRWFKTWEPVDRRQVQRILEVTRMTNSPGNLQPWRAVVVYRDDLDPDTRETLLKADNWQGAHTQAPVWIYFFADPLAAVPAKFAEGTAQLIEAGAAPRQYGWDVQTIRDALEHGKETPEGMTALHEFQGLPMEISAAIAHSETVGACAFAHLAATNEGLGSALHQLSKPSMVATVKEILGVPDHFIPVWVLLVGHPAEDMAAGGQRPRNDFGDMFHEGTWGNPMPRDETVVADLVDEGLIQAAAPLPQREEELKFLARMYGYPEV